MQKSFLMLFALNMVPSAEPWSWKTHSDIVDAIYYALPPEVQKNLDPEDHEECI